MTGLYERTLLLEGQSTNLWGYSGTAGAVGTRPTGMYEHPANPPVVSTDRDLDGNGLCVKHVRNPSANVDTNVGYRSYYTSELIPFTFSCYVWIPSGISGLTDVKIGLEGTFSPGIGVSLDLSRRDQWQRATITGTPGGAGTIVGILRVYGAVPDGTAIYSDCWQLEKSPHASSWIRSTGAETVTRGADSCTFDFTRPPEACTVYARFYEQGTAFITSYWAKLLQIGGPGANLHIYGRSGRYGVHLHNGTVYHNTTSGTLSSVAMGDLVEVAAQVGYNSRLNLFQAIQGGTPVATGDPGSSVLMPAAWGSQKFYLGSNHGLMENGFAAFTHVGYFPVIMSMEECRERLGVR